jgi:hypothetical protein
MSINSATTSSLVWLLRKSKEGDGFQGWHKDFLLGKQITKTIAINVGSKERDNEETTRSFDNDVSFEVDDWKEIEDYALSGFNSEDKHPQDEKTSCNSNQKPISQTISNST